MSEPQKRSRSKRALPEEKFHPLFPPPEDAPDDVFPEPIAHIMIVRHDVDKPRTALRTYAPEELMDLGTLHTLYGGGVYELIAKRPNGTVYRRCRYILDGPPKSLNGDPAPQAAQTSSPVQALMQEQPQGNPTDKMLHLLTTLLVAQITSQGNVMAALAAGGSKEAVNPVAQLAPVIDALRAFAPQPAPVITAPVQTQTPVQQLKELIELRDAVQPQPHQKEESTSETIANIVQGFAPIVGQILQRGGAPGLPSGPMG